jgi:hypothetical protein
MVLQTFTVGTVSSWAFTSPRYIITAVVFALIDTKTLPRPLTTDFQPSLSCLLVVFASEPRRAGLSAGAGTGRARSRSFLRKCHDQPAADMLSGCAKPGGTAYHLAPAPLCVGRAVESRLWLCKHGACARSVAARPVRRPGARACGQRKPRACDVAVLKTDHLAPAPQLAGRAVGLRLLAL